MKEGGGIALLYKWENQDPDKLRAFSKPHSGVARNWTYQPAFLQSPCAYWLSCSNDSFIFLKKVFAYRMVPLKPVACGQPNRLNHSMPEGCCFLITECNCTSVPQCLPRLRGGCLWNRTWLPWLIHILCVGAEREKQFKTYRTIIFYLNFSL